MQSSQHRSVEHGYFAHWMRYTNFPEVVCLERLLVAVYVQYLREPPRSTRYLQLELEGYCLLAPYRTEKVEGFLAVSLMAEQIVYDGLLSEQA